MSAHEPSEGGRGSGSGDAATVVWVTGGGCDGCTMSVLGASAPRLEELLSGGLTHIPRVEFVHPVLALESGDSYLATVERAAAGGLEPFILVVEGSLFDQRLAGEGAFSRLGIVDGEPVAVETWIGRLAPRAAAVVAIGTCASWGGIPAARGNCTGAMSLQSFLGADFVSAGGLPVVNVPGCAPNGDSFVELISYVLLHLGGLVPLRLDDLSRPSWLYASSTPLSPAGASPSQAAPEELADCSVPSRGWINQIGGCAAVGGACNGCTRADFPDRTLVIVPRVPVA